MMIALEERIVTFLASFFEINAYDQPGVQDGKLAASGVNKASFAIVGGLEKILGKISGNANSILTQIGVQENYYEAEAILSDIFINRTVPNSYPSISTLKVSRDWAEDNNEFLFTFEK